MPHALTPCGTSWRDRYLKSEAQDPLPHVGVQIHWRRACNKRCCDLWPVQRGRTASERNLCGGEQLYRPSDICTLMQTGSRREATDAVHDWPPLPHFPIPVLRGKCLTLLSRRTSSWLLRMRPCMGPPLTPPAPSPELVDAPAPQSEVGLSPRTTGKPLWVVSVRTWRM